MTQWDNFKLWYTKPAEQWVEALPIGCGRLGAMVFGQVQNERIQFNEDTLWTGGPHDYHRKSAVKQLPQIRQLLFDGKQEQAEKLAFKYFMGNPKRQKAYQPCGNLRLSFADHEDITNYYRDLNLDTGIATTTYQVNDVIYTRQVFASNPAQAIVIHLSTNKPNQLTFTASLDSPHARIEHQVLEDEQISLTGKVARNPMAFEARLLTRVKNGYIAANEDALYIQDADAVTLILTAATNFKDFKKLTTDPTKRCSQTIRALQNKTFDSLLEEHLQDHQSLFRRMSIHLGNPIDEPTNQRLAKLPERSDPHLLALYFQYGRYLLIASSRAGSQPANLQGIWNDHLEPPWDSKWTVNINTEMNYWPAESCNLSPCHQPLFDMLEEVAITGQKTARPHYGARGWVLHHNTDIWRGSAPINASNHGIWPTGGAWLCQHLWWHYEYTRDRDFLRNKAYPLMKGAAQFFVDQLIEDPRTGHLISTPSNSPENGGLVAGPTMDHQIIRDLFTNCIDACRTLRIDTQFCKTLIAKRKRIAPHQIGRLGQLQEWLEDVDDPENTHRHVSHLWGLHPGKEITPEKTPDLFEAAKKSLEFRTDEGTGWSMGWKLNFWARFRDGDRAHTLLQRQLRLVGETSTQMKGGGTYPNLFDAHPPFQIDGNFGATAGMAELLLQNHTGDIHLLPALPSAWPNGNIEGLRARGGIELDITWNKGHLTQAILYATKTGVQTVRYRDKFLKFKTHAKKAYIIDHNLQIHPLNNEN
ncbi:MAG: glycoside hydrolase family 95 protein [Candidatus Latescibacterota bacterium]